MVLLAGTPPLPVVSNKRWRIFFGPQCGHFWRNRRMRLRQLKEVALGLRPGRELLSSSPNSPERLYRSHHL